MNNAKRGKKNRRAHLYGHDGPEYAENNSADPGDAAHHRWAPARFNTFHLSSSPLKLRLFRIFFSNFNLSWQNFGYFKIIFCFQCSFCANESLQHIYALHLAIDSEIIYIVSQSEQMNKCSFL